MILTFTEFKDSAPTASGKTAPAKAKAGKNWYALGRDIHPDLIKVNIGVPLECEVSSKPSADGKYQNWYLNKAALPIPQTLPPTQEAAGSSPPAVSIPASAEKIAPRAFVPDEDKQRLIVRQSAIKAAVELKAIDKYPDLSLWDLAEEIVSWVYEKGDVYDLEAEQVNRDGEAEPVAAFRAASAPSSPAHQHLAEARARAKSITDSYDDADAVCPGCGRKEYLKQWSGGWFCAKSKVAGQPGGCGYPAKGERLDAPVSWGEFKERSAVRRPDAQVVSPRTHPSLSR